jgi:hypothetical protein
MPYTDWDTTRRKIFATESGGDYNALYNYQNKPNGAFSGTNLQGMTVDQALKFADPSGPYGQYVKANRPDKQYGVATPMGAYQVVGSTLNEAKRGLGLRGDEVMTPDLQDKIGRWVYKTQGSGAWAGLQQPNATKSTKGNSNMEPMQQPTGLLGMFGLQKRDPSATGETAMPFYQRPSFKDAVGGLAIGLNSMRLNPDPNTAKIVQDAKQGRQDTATKNKTVEYLRNAGYEDYARAVEGGSISAKDMMSALVTKSLETPKDTRTAQIQNYEYWLSQGKTPQEAEALVKSGGINIGAGETAWAKGIGEMGVKQLTKIQEDASSALAIQQKASMLEALMQDPEFKSGALTNTETGWKKIIEALGGDPANVASREGFAAVASQLVLDMMGGSLGAGFSEGDRKFVERMQPSLNTTVEGNKLLISMQRKVAQRKLEVSDFATKYIQEKGRIDEYFMGALSKWSNENPMFGEGPNPEGYFD